MGHLMVGRVGDSWSANDAGFANHRRPRDSAGLADRWCGSGVTGGVGQQSSRPALTAPTALLALSGDGPPAG